MRSSHFSTPRGALRLLVPLVVSAGFAGACGGVTSIVDERHRTVGADSGNGTGGTPAQCLSCDKGPPPSLPLCGNGVLDQNEACDGMLFQSTNCLVLSMGTVRAAKLLCTPQCQIELLDCQDARIGTPCSSGQCPTPDASVGTCDPRFCPANGLGKGCCLSSNGPCGVDYGMGCVPPTVDGGR